MTITVTQKEYCMSLPKEERCTSMNLPAPLADGLAGLARQYGARRLVLFGSRARGDNGPRSDIDLAVFGMPEANRSAFWMGTEELPTLLKFDIAHVSPDMDPAFLENIEKEGVTLYEQNEA